MGERDAGAGAEGDRDRLLETLEGLLDLEAATLRAALDGASDRIAGALGADKVDVFLYEPESKTLVAAGTSDTPMGRAQHNIGLDRQPVANGGPMVGVYETGRPYITGRAEEDPEMPRGYIGGLGIRSSIMVPVEIGGERRGALQADSGEPDRFTEGDLRFLGASARWVGMVAHRAELTEALARDAAEAARRATADELVTALAHDLRNHLTPLGARVDLIHRRAGRLDDAKLIEHAEEARLALSRLRRMIAAMLDVARLDQGLFALSLQPVDLAHMARDAAAMLGAGGGGVEVRAPEELVVRADPDALRQALENLLANALKYSPDGAPVALEAGEEDTRDGRRAVVAVRDSGPGIAPELMPRLFERFASGPRSDGLGLGLYLARGIAEAHGGTLTADSKPGKGAAFRLALPLDAPA
jgi:signal transduction histidine kinase